ncbi:MAG TPA: hypothetical protein VF472_12635 [Burkholderiaceae bacterium]
MNTLAELSPELIPIVALFIPIVAIIATAAVKISRANLLHETVRHLAASGQPIPPELLAKIVDPKS